MININGLSKAYGSHIVLRDIHLSLQQGMVYGIVGDNGSGKTTMFKCIAGLESFHGTITGQHPLFKNHIGYLSAEPYYFSKITGREYLQLLCNARGVGHVDLNTKNIFELPLDQYASTYSTGMKKKLAFTAILLQQNQLYILDEPFNGVDIHSNMIVTEIIDRLRKLNKTILISSHIFATLKQTCDQIHVLEQGQITRSVGASEFDALESEMKNFTVQEKVNKFGLE